MTTQLLVIRHGETAWNAEHRIQGHLDIPLSATGFRQAARLAERLAGERVDAVYSSELARAWLTALPLAERLGLEVVPEPRLRERCVRCLRGTDARRDRRAALRGVPAWRGRDPLWAMEGGETGQQLIDRVLEALHDIAGRHRGQTVAIVTHGGVLDVAYRAARALDWDAPREHQMLNASINRVRVTFSPPALAMVDWGDVAHLTESRDETLT